tara:strand:+ start:55 stop:504 length:450 start_codon:yes stop_codon:yes gene_type:complete
MNFYQLLHLSLKNDLLQDFKNLNLDDNFLSRINYLIDSKINMNHIIFHPQDQFNPNKCHARVWNQSYGSQCSCEIKQNNLCNRHHKQSIDSQYGVHNLRLGFYNDPKPLYDINKDGSQGKKRLWKKSVLEQIDIIIQSQHHNLFNLINK